MRFRGSHRYRSQASGRVACSPGFVISAGSGASARLSRDGSFRFNRRRTARGRRQCGARVHAGRTARPAGAAARRPGRRGSRTGRRSAHRRRRNGLIPADDGRSARRPVPNPAAGTAVRSPRWSCRFTTRIRCARPRRCRPWPRRWRGNGANRRLRDRRAVGFHQCRRVDPRDIGDRWLRKSLAAVMPVWYRRRWRNIARKSGNLEDSSPAGAAATST